MKHLLSPLTLLAVLIGSTAEARENELVGHFTSLDRSGPGCGYLFIGTKATFVADGSRTEVTVVVPCIEMQTATSRTGQPELLKPKSPYRITVTTVRPKNLSTPADNPGLLYLVKATELSGPAA